MNVFTMANLRGIDLTKALEPASATRRCNLFRFNFVTVHYIEKASMYGMLDYSKHVIQDRVTVYADQHDMGVAAE
jgi:methylisocitrate lyase